jgi:hypothetical protein
MPLTLFDERYLMPFTIDRALSPRLLLQQMLSGATHRPHAAAAAAAAAANAADDDGVVG